MAGNFLRNGANVCLRVSVQTPFFSGVITTAVLGNPIYDLIIGNIPGVKDSSVQSDRNTVTRAAGKRKARTDSIVVASPSEIINNPEVIQEQGTDPTLEGVRKYLSAGNVKVTCNSRSRFVQIQGRIFREFVSSHGEKLLQFVVPERYRHAVFLLEHRSEGGGHLGRNKTLDNILTNFYWPGIGHTSRK